MLLDSRSSGSPPLRASQPRIYLEYPPYTDHNGIPIAYLRPDQEDGQRCVLLLSRLLLMMVDADRVVQMTVSV